jgi:hypothetical protein
MRKKVGKKRYIVNHCNFHEISNLATSDHRSLSIWMLINLEVVIQTCLLSNNADSCSPSENHRPEQSSLKARKWTNALLVGRRARFIWCPLKKGSHRHMVFSCNQFHSNMPELAANNISAHQLSDCIGFSRREGTLFLYMCERDSPLTDVSDSRWHPLLNTWMNEE